MKINYLKLDSQKQRGATLITALMMLLVMTILGVSAVRITTIDMVIASNDQQKIMLMQETESDLNNLTTPTKLFGPLVGVEGAFFDAQTKAYTVPEPTNPLAVEIITDLDKLYDCEGIGGKAVSMGPDVPPCRLYDFQVNARKANSGAREIRRRGAGKEVPNTGKNSYLNRL